MRLVKGARAAALGSAGAILAAAGLTGAAPALARPAASALTGTAPVVTAVKPADGSEAGGTKVKVKGTHMKGVTSVSFGATVVTLAAPNKSEKTVSVVSPAGSGTVDVTVSGPEGTSEVVPADRFTYVSLAPTVTKLSPNHSTASAQKAVTISGTNFTGATEVHFGPTSVPFTLVNAKKIKVTAPPAVADGPNDVTVTTPQGTSATNPGDQFIFEAEEPFVDTMTPEIGSTGETIAIEGEGFIGASEVLFGTTPATSFEVVNDVEILAVLPPHPTERAVVRVRTPLGLSPEVCPAKCERPIGHFKFRPSITSISPSSGPLAGGTTLTITGTNFEVGIDRIDFLLKEVEAECTSETVCTVVAPAGKEAGTVPVQIHIPTNYNSKESVSPITEATQFTYE